MQDPDAVKGLQGLHQDLLAFSHGQLRNVERLWAQLDARVSEFRQLIDRPEKNEASRKKLFSGNLHIGDEEYTVNKEFQENATQLADIVNLDEVEAAKLLLEAQEDVELGDRTIIAAAIISFQRRRQFLLECLRLTLTIPTNSEVDEHVRRVSRDTAGLILGGREGSLQNGPAYIQKCLRAMSAIEVWLQGLGQRAQGAAALGQDVSQDIYDTIPFQQQSLNQQHESLSGIVTLLAKASYSSSDNFRAVIDHMACLDRWGTLSVNYAPVVLALILQHGSPEGVGSLREARVLHEKIMESKEASVWTLRHYQAAIQTWWLAEYSGWYQEEQPGSPLQGVDLQSEAIGRSQSFFKALKEGAFECTLAMCSQMKMHEKYNPARSSLVSFLLRDAPTFQQDSVLSSPWFEALLTEQLEMFVDALITNMPDTLRQFKSEEDDQRKRIYSNLQKVAPSAFTAQDFHLERFLLIVSYSFDQRTEAAHSFWSDPDSNLYGFLQWAAKRQSTPCVSAFCEMLQSISKSEQYATSVHQLLLDESGGPSSRLRRYGSLSWSQILGELSTFTAQIRGPPHSQQTRGPYGGKADVDDIGEPESILMLESYLRLVSHLCTESSEARAWILSQTGPPILDLLFTLCNPGVNLRLQACAFMTVRSFLTAKSAETAMNVWAAFDSWACGGYATPAIARQSKMPLPLSWLEDITINVVTASFDQANEFTVLLWALMEPVESTSSLDDQLPFPENLGSTYRMSGVEPYIDLVLDRIFIRNVTFLEDPLMSNLLNSNILGLLMTCISSFNEDLLILASKPSISVDESMKATNLATYVRMHPFARVMEWLFNDRVLSTLLEIAHAELDDITTALPGSVLLQRLISSIGVLNLLFDLQSTYLNVVRPLVKDQPSAHRRLASNASLASFEDRVALKSQLIVDLGLYSGLGHQQLAEDSLKLLGKLASLRSLSVQPLPSPSRQTNPLIGILQREDDLERIARPLNLAMEIDPRELEQGPSGAGWSIKSVILEFLVMTLSATPDQPSIAHALLGFGCRQGSIDITPEGPFAMGMSLFHAVVQLVAEYPDGHGPNLQLWALSLRQMGMEVLSLLWRSPLTSAVTLLELRRCEFLFRLLRRQRSVNINTLWNERSVAEPDFSSSESAAALQQYLWQRNSLYEYANSEIRFLAEDGGTLLRSRELTALLGLTVTPEGEQLPNLTIFDLFDYVDLAPPSVPEMPSVDYFATIDFTALTEEARPRAGVRYDMKLIEEALSLRLELHRREGRLQDANEEQRAIMGAAQILRYFQSSNSLSGYCTASESTLASWCQLVTCTIGICDTERDVKTAFLLQALQLTTPKLEIYATENDAKAIHVAKLLRSLVSLYESGSMNVQDPYAGEITHDRAYPVFWAAIRSISASDIDTSLREVLYQICRTISMQSLAKAEATGDIHQIMHAVKTAGARTLDVMFDDVLGASHSSRVSALLLLDAFCMLAAREKSTYIIESLVCTNFLQILVESIGKMPNELRDTHAQDIPLLLTFYESKFSLLLTIVQVKAGAAQVIKAGLFRAVQVSGLFAVDPDIGVEIDNPDALAKYYRLLLFITRIVTSIIVSHGAQNDSIIENGRSFLRENRALIVATLKRQAKIGGISFDDAGINIDELVELFILLITATGYLEFDDSMDFTRRRTVSFT